MAFPLKDVRFTTRRSAAGTQLYPRLLRDRTLLPQIDIAIQYFETMLGRERREFESEVLVHFFGDPKLARCLVAGLGRAYRFHAPALDEVVTRTALRRLYRAGIRSPGPLRLWLFDRLNDLGPGFLASAERADRLAALEGELGLRAGQLERLLSLDDAEHAILTRFGEPPRPADVLAQHNFGVLEGMLRHARQVELQLADSSAETADAVADLCAALDVDLDLRRAGPALRVQLHGRPDALGVWTRHGRHLARALLLLIERARPDVAGGQAMIELRGRTGLLKLTDEVLDILAGAPAPPTGWDAPQPWDQARGAEVAAALRGAGWSARRFPEPQAWAAGLVLPDLLLRAGAQRYFLCGVRSPAHGARLTPVARVAASGEPLLFIGTDFAVAPLRAAGATTRSVPGPEPRAVADALADLLAPASSASRAA